MLVFNSEMHLITLLFILLELMMLACQLFYYYSRPEDRQRLWFLILLVLLLFYNITGGMLPDERLWLPVPAQNILAYGSGFLMASYFPWYFYKVFDLSELHFHALYGVGLFLLLPYLLFIGIVYPISSDLNLAIRWGMIIPFVYSLVLLWSIISAIRRRMLMKNASSRPYFRLELYAVGLAVTPWVSMSAFSYLQISQWIEALVTNAGFIGVSVLYMVRSAALNRMEHSVLLALHRERSLNFEKNCSRFKLTEREREIALLLCRGKTYHQIGDWLFISGKTVDHHIQNIFTKTGVRNKMRLLQLLSFGVKATDVYSMDLDNHLTHARYEGNIR